MTVNQNQHIRFLCLVCILLFFFFSTCSFRLFLPLSSSLYFLWSSLKHSSKKREIVRKFPVITLLSTFQIIKTKLQIDKNGKQKIVLSHGFVAIFSLIIVWLLYSVH